MHVSHEGALSGHLEQGLWKELPKQVTKAEGDDDETRATYAKERDNLLTRKKFGLAMTTAQNHIRQENGKRRLCEVCTISVFYMIGLSGISPGYANRTAKKKWSTIL